MQRIISLLLAIVVFFPITSFAQSRKRTTTKSNRSATMPKGSEIQREAATRVADQIKILTKFIYLLGGVAKELEDLDNAAKRKEASPTILEQAQRSKQTVRASITARREELDKLEIYFRTTPELERYYSSLAGVAESAAVAEDQAAANKFDQAGRSLLGVVNRLTDTLLAMR